jgi:anti-sigma-K factor RskA
LELQQMQIHRINEMNEQHVDNLLDLYVLGALEPDESAHIEAHLDTCVRCRAQLTEAKRVVELLALTPEQFDPPPHLRARVLDHVAQLQRAERPPRPTFWQRFQFAFQPPAARWSLAASTALLVATLALGGRTLQLQQQVSTLNTQMSTLNTQLAQQQEVLEVVQSPGIQVASLTAPATDTAARAQLLFDATGQRAYLVTANLPPLPADQTYQFWLIDDQPTSAGLFSVDQRGVGELLVDAQQPIEAYEAVGISIEPAGGSAAPTPDAIVLLGSL